MINYLFKPNMSLIDLLIIGLLSDLVFPVIGHWVWPIGFVLIVISSTIETVVCKWRVYR